MLAVPDDDSLVEHFQLDSRTIVYKFKINGALLLILDATLACNCMFHVVHWICFSQYFAVIGEC